MRSPLFDQANREQETGQRWTVQSSKMLRVALGPEVLAAQGAMVAYQGNIDFSYQGSRSLGGMVKKAVTGEGGNLMRVAGQGEVFFARSAQNVFLLQLEGDAITVNTPSLLAFDAHLGYDIKMLGNAGLLAGGLFNLMVQGQGVVAVSSDGPPMLLDCSQQPTFVDPQAAICWSANLQPQIKSSFKMGSLIGRGSGESSSWPSTARVSWWSSPARASRWWRPPERGDDDGAGGRLPALRFVTAPCRIAGRQVACRVREDRCVPSSPECRRRLTSIRARLGCVSRWADAR